MSELMRAGRGRRVLVTGAGGFVGRRLCGALAEAGWTVLGALRNSGQPPVGSKAVALSLLTDPEAWQQALEGVDCVVHLAAAVHRMGRAADAAEYFRINYEGSKFVAAQAAAARVRRLVFLSSIKVNGEGSERAYCADDEPKPVDSYGQSKLAAERALLELSGAKAMEVAIVRPPLVYGPGVRANFRRFLQLVALGVPLPFAAIRNRRSLVGIDNLVDFVITLMQHPNAAGRPWLVSDGADISTPDLFAKSRYLMGKSARLFSLPTPLLKTFAGLVGQSAAAARLCDSLTVDISPARSMLNWSPPRTLDEQLDLTVRAFMRPGDL